MSRSIRLLKQSVCLLLLSYLAFPAEIPVRNIVLYKHGIGYFERTATIASGEEARLDFKNADMNDVLKSLTVTDRAGERVSAIRYDSNATLTQQLQDFPFQITPDERLSAFLDGLRGAHLEVKTGDRAIAGNIVSARALNTAAEANATVLREQITLLLDSGELANFDLSQLASLRLTDPLLQQKLRDYLLIVSKAKAHDKRSIYIDSTGSAARELKIAYIAPVAIWKSSYRLTLADSKSRLEGWAIVDNTTDEDWNNVGLSVVSGRPISFISLLDQPRFRNRVVADLPEDRAAAPEVFGGAVDAAAPKTARQSVANQLMAPRSLPAPPPPPKLETAAQAEESTIQGATGGTLGELFQYNFASPVTIKRNQSAMLPFLQDRIAAQKLLIYLETDGEHPVNAAEITNTSGKTLDGGPITVYDAGAYAGEALVETLKAGDKRLIGYAVDYGTRVTSAFESVDQHTLEIHAANGTLEIKTAIRDTKTYEIKNVDPKSKALVVQQPAQPEYKLLSPKPAERTANAYRFEVQVPGNGTQALKVEQERVTSETTAVSSASPDSLLEIVSGRGLNDAARTQLREIIDIKQRVAAAQSALDANKAAADEPSQDQTRLRQNIDSLNRVNGQQDRVREYSNRLNDNEVKLAALRDKRDELKQNLAALTGSLAASIGKLRF